jgi:multidrug efflux pump subunit AcrA (membrane-fusion protein)
MKQPKVLIGCLVLTALFLAASAVPSQEGGVTKPTGVNGGKPAASDSVKVEKGHFQATVTLKGVFAPTEMTEVVLRPEAWTPHSGGVLSVLSAVEHGTSVKKGDVILTMQTDKLDRAIRDLEGDLQLGQLSIRLAEEELPVLEKSLPLDLTAAERGKIQADEDLKKFLEVDRPLAEATATNMLKSSQHYLDYAKEELKQLQKMYRSKDLTEETEEIILKRQKHQVEMAEFQVKSATVRRDQTLKVDLPRQEQHAKEHAVKQALSWEKARASLPLAAAQKRLALDKLKYEHAKGTERLQNLKKDRDAMTVKAPEYGIVYHGKCVKGQWNSAAVTPRLSRGGNLMPDEVVMTIVTEKRPVLDAVVEEKDLHWLTPGAKGKATPLGYPDLRLGVELTSLSAVPQSAGSFAAVFKLDGETVPPTILPGMACTIKVVAYRKENALTLPSSAVFTDDDEGHYVYRAGSKAKVNVKVGKAANDRTEILEGLAEGDAVLPTKP